jgi:The  BURPS668_1122 family of deaminases
VQILRPCGQCALTIHLSKIDEAARTYGLESAELTKLMDEGMQNGGALADAFQKDLRLIESWKFFDRAGPAVAHLKNDLEKLKALADDLQFHPNLAAELNGNAGLVKAWDAIFSNGTLRTNIDNLRYVDDYVTQNSISLASIRSNFDALIPARQQSFINGLRHGTSGALGISVARNGTPDEIADAVNRIADHRSSNSWTGNWGLLEGQTTPAVNLANPDGTTTFWRTIPLADAENEIHIFTAINASGSNGSEWLRITDSEYRMLNRFASDYGAVSGGRYYDISGTIKIVSENPYCPSCQGIIQQFNTMFPNINLILIDGIR